MTSEKDLDNNVWHALASGEVCRELRVDPAVGLAPSEVEERQSSHGPNRLPEAGRDGPLKRLLLQFHNLLIYVLLAAAVGTAFLQEWIDFAVILGVVVINAMVGYIQEGKAEKALDSIRKMLSADASVTRGGKTRTLPAEELVPGDVIHLQSGDKVPADARLVEVRNLRVEEAALTGESVPVGKETDPVEEKASLGDRKGMVYSGTLVVSGRATAVVVGTGAHTELGRINSMLSGVRGLQTPLLRQIAGFARILTVVILGAGLLTLLFGVFFRDYLWGEMFLAVVGLAVAAIPEGLPAIITITLAIGVQRMARRKAIIRRLPAVETLGSVTRICSDKTGTLTRNEMMAVSVATAEHDYDITGEGYRPEGEIRSASGSDAGSDGVLEKIALVSLLCQEAVLEQTGEGWVLHGDPTEGALLAMGGKAGHDGEALKQRHPRMDAVPFESEHRFMATLHEGEGGKRFLLVKGAPEVILNHCDRQAKADGSTETLNAGHWREKGDVMARRGERVLALAWQPECQAKSGDLNADSLPRDLVFLGLTGIMDPPREEAVNAVAECHGGGIRVTMITGDHATTAVSIAQKLGIGDGKTVQTGVELEEMSDDELRTVCADVDVFARSSPEHKLRLVRAMQAEGHILAMTGDGVNDAPALKQADVGVAMGIKGTEVSKEASEMVLADDNFASITAAVREGRTVYDNIQKALLFILPTNGAQALTIMAAVLFGMVLPITPPQILWVNMVTAVTLALALAFEPMEPDVMRRPPRRVNRPLLNAFGVWRVGFVSILLLGMTFGFFFWMQQQGAGVELSRTAAVNALIVGQVFYLLNSRFLLRSSLSFRDLTGNPVVLLAIGVILFLQLLFTYFGPMQILFRTEPLPPLLWLWIGIGGLVVFLIVELEKAWLRAREKR